VYSSARPYSVCTYTAGAGETLSQVQCFYETAPGEMVMVCLLSAFGQEMSVKEGRSVLDKAWEWMAGYLGSVDEMTEMAKWRGKCCYCENVLVRKPKKEPWKPGANRTRNHWLKRIKWTEEHLVPRSKGGNNGHWNLRDCCHACNEDRNNLSLEEWLAGLEGLLSLSKNPKRIRRLEIKIGNIQLWIGYVRKYGHLLYRWDYHEAQV
jgi:hypothetical protein